MAEVVEKVFKHFLDVPSDVRIVMIDEMEVKDKCRLSGCSKICNIEAKSSKNYLYQLDLTRYADNIRIAIVHEKYPIDFEHDRPHWQHGYELIFHSYRGKKLKIGKRLGSNSLWEVELEESADLVQYGLEEFETLLRIHQKKIKKLHIKENLYDDEYTSVLGNSDFGIENLNSLEELGIMANVNVLHILSKLRKPLKVLTISGVHRDDVLECQQVYQVQHRFEWINAKLDHRQFLQLRAKNVMIHIGHLTEENICNFIRSWQNGTIGKKIGVHRWFLEGSTFDSQKLAQLLGVHPQTTEIYNQDGKSAELGLAYGRLGFSTIPYPGIDFDC